MEAPPSVVIHVCSLSSYTNRLAPASACMLYAVRFLCLYLQVPSSTSLSQSSLSAMSSCHLYTLVPTPKTNVVGIGIIALCLIPIIMLETDHAPLIDFSCNANLYMHLQSLAHFSSCCSTYAHPSLDSFISSSGLVGALRMTRHLLTSYTWLHLPPPEPNPTFHSYSSSAAFSIHWLLALHYHRARVLLHNYSSAASKWSWE